MRSSIALRLLCIAILACFLGSACAFDPSDPGTMGLGRLGMGQTAPEKPADEKAGAAVQLQSQEGFKVVQAQAGDTYAALATRYLNDPGQANLVAEFNDNRELGPGRDVIIPLKALSFGGITPEGYQVVPVLAYTDFSSGESDPTTVAASDFEQQMQFIKDQGFTVVTLNQLMDFLNMKASLPAKSVAITMDGGRGVYDVAFPVLKKFGYPATLFLRTDRVGAKGGLTWDQVREMNKQGLDVECGGMTDRDLEKYQRGESFDAYFKAVENEVARSKALIKQKLGLDCKYLAYPGRGGTNALVIEVLKREGFQGAFTMERGGNPFFINTYRVGRTAIPGTYRLADFERNVTVFKNEAKR